MQKRSKAIIGTMLCVGIGGGLGLALTAISAPSLSPDTMLTVAKGISAGVVGTLVVGASLFLISELCPRQPSYEDSRSTNPIESTVSSPSSLSLIPSQRQLSNPSSKERASTPSLASIEDAPALTLTISSSPRNA